MQISKRECRGFEVENTKYKNNKRTFTVAEVCNNGNVSYVEGFNSL